MKKRFALAFTFAMLFSAVPALAVTAGDVLDKMTSVERNGYLSGAIEMAMYLTATNEKNGPKAECIRQWYYDNPESARQIVGMFDANKTRPAAGLLKILMERACGR